MAIVVKSCPSCKCVIEVEGNYRGIGIPYKTCPYCNSTIIDESDTEWELKNINQKIGYILICGWTIILYGLIVPIIVHIINTMNDIETSNSQFFSFYLLGIGICLVIIYKSLVKEIKESKERMKDRNYRMRLKQLGLLD
jgi:hypothetical protein